MITFGVHTSPTVQSAVVVHSLQNVSGKTPPVSMSWAQVSPAAHPIAAGSHITPSSPLVHAAASVVTSIEHVPTPAT